MKELAKCSGFRAETLTSLEKCSNFKRTHLFLMQVWEALYREIFEAFCKNRQGTVLPLFAVVLSEVHKHLQTTASLSQLQSHIHTKLAATVVEREFYEFVEKLSSADDTWRFWKQFVFGDCYAYVCLFTAIRTGNWKLRVSSLKQVTPLFAAFDWPSYQKIITQHLEDTLTYPEIIRHCFEHGAFVVSIKDRPGHSVALDKCNEMCMMKT